MGVLDVVCHKASRIVNEASGAVIDSLAYLLAVTGDLATSDLQRPIAIIHTRRREPKVA
jgi:hypothetical protein